MALPSWPEGLRHRPTRDGFQVLSAHRPPVWTEFEDGPPLARRSGLGRRARLAYRIEFWTPAEYEIFRNFVETTLADGSSRFTMPVYVPATNDYAIKTVMIERGEVTAEPLGIGFIVSFTLIVFDW